MLWLCYDRFYVLHVTVTYFDFVSIEYATINVVFWAAQNDGFIGEYCGEYFL